MNLSCQQQPRPHDIMMHGGSSSRKQGFSLPRADVGNKRHHGQQRCTQKAPASSFLFDLGGGDHRQRHGDDISRIAKASPSAEQQQQKQQRSKQRRKHAGDHHHGRKQPPPSSAPTAASLPHPATPMGDNASNNGPFVPRVVRADNNSNSNSNSNSKNTRHQADLATTVPHKRPAYPDRPSRMRRHDGTAKGYSHPQPFACPQERSFPVSASAFPPIDRGSDHFRTEHSTRSLPVRMMSACNRQESFRSLHSSRLEEESIFPTEDEISECIPEVNVDELLAETPKRRVDVHGSRPSEERVEAFRQQTSAARIRSVPQVVSSSSSSSASSDDRFCAERNDDRDLYGFNSSHGRAGREQAPARRPVDAVYGASVPRPLSMASNSRASTASSSSLCPASMLSSLSSHSNQQYDSIAETEHAGAFDRITNQRQPHVSVLHPFAASQQPTDPRLSRRKPPPPSSVKPKHQPKPPPSNGLNHHHSHHSKGICDLDDDLGELDDERLFFPSPPPAQNLQDDILDYKRGILDRHCSSNNINNDCYPGFQHGQYHPQPSSLAPLPPQIHHPQYSVPPTGQESNPSNKVMVQVAPNEYMHLRGADETWDCIMRGLALSVTCMECLASLQCVPDCQVVLCPRCKMMTPLFTSSGGGGKGGVGLGNVVVA
eukprot:CAMPEP_0119551438 /NCGR_PEP_ID=MMETSP1352-20130426/4696_1 /TAXON_ID=265584 /ORGANISM="Stauroneis constricta, Strain CCMP1120" /LENGTH=657 /DNA_ID=CAMNT_0007597497 /DNA_START=101 /DNA_END=2074 /DNA_ORIENTATION=+